MQAEVGALTGTRFAYVSSASDNAIQIFTAADKTGVLQPVSVFSVGAGKAPAALALAPNGNFLYSLNRGTNDISVYAIDPSSGNLTNAGSVPVPNGPNAMVFSAKGEFAYVSCDGASTIAAFAVNLGSGSLSPLSAGSYAAGGARIQNLAITQDGKFLYAANPDANQIIALTIASDGSLLPVTGSPFPVQPGLSSIVLSEGNSSLGGPNLYAGSNNGIEGYDRNPSTGALTYLSSVTQASAGKSPLLFQNTSDGLLIGVSPQNGGGFSYAFDYFAPIYGAYLSPGGPPVSTGTSPVAGAWLWNAYGTNWVYVLNGKADASAATGSIGVYPVDYSNGMVGPTTVIPTSLHNPSGFVVTP
jgi:6-phosphogluconolactonase (cycloisomerase 2 family)